MKRLTKCIAYMKAIPGIDAARVAELATTILPVAPGDEIEKVLKIPIGAENKLKSVATKIKAEVKGDADTARLDAKTKEWRTAARSLLALAIAREYKGGISLDEFLEVRRKDLLKIATEGELREKIKQKVNSPVDGQSGGIAPGVNKPRLYVGTDRGLGTEAFIHKDLPDFNAEPIIFPGGTWAYDAWESKGDLGKSQQPHYIDFAANPHVMGIYTTSASGGCFPLAVLYGGGCGQPYKAAVMVHLPGGDSKDVRWEDMKFKGGSGSTVAARVLLNIPTEGNCFAAENPNIMLPRMRAPSRIS